MKFLTWDRLPIHVAVARSSDVFVVLHADARGRERATRKMVGAVCASSIHSSHRRHPRCPLHRRSDSA
jgi:hypothetical protein